MGLGRDGEFEAAVASHTPALLASARLVLSNDAEAWDAVQNTIEAALKHAESLRDPGALRPWLLAIQSRQMLRIRQRARRALSLDVVAFGLPSSPGPTVERLAVRDALARLPLRIRTAVVLHYMVGLPIAEVADAMGVSVNTVKSQVRVGAAKLREILSDE